MQSTGDIQIPQPSTSDSDQQTPEAQQQPGTPSTNSGPGLDDFMSLVGRNEPQSLSGNQIIIGIGISLVLAVLFWFVGRIVTDTLVKQFAEVGAAKRAGLALTAFLSVIGVAITFGILGNFWLVPFFFAPAGALTALLALVSLFTFIGANRSKRK
ncbi:MAG: hypothetical protein GC166_04450 [Alphaproteobacteria bacterium]|nr:hypothetical protein [Alphaproteobacteria bacterium]